jgi:VWA domain-containing protein
VNSALHLLVAVLALDFGIGCAGLQLTTVKTAEQQPSNVAVYFKVQTETGGPVAGLTADQFRIYEDGQLVSRYESKQTIINPEVAAAHYTLLLVDMSGSVSNSGSVDSLVQAARTFTDRIEKQEKVGVYAFDGTPDLYPIVPFTDQPGSAKAGIAQLSTFKPRDPSTNLNGAVVKALDELDVALSHASQPMRFGTLVVFTDGTDRASRVPEATMLQHVREMPFDVFAIGLGGEIKPSRLDAIGKTGKAMAADKNAIVKAFDDIGAQIDGRTRSFYLLSYCSPSRAGKHDVRIEAALNDAKGHEVRSGSVTSEFDATGFAPGCDPSTPPSFDVSKGDALSARPPAARERPIRADKESKQEAKSSHKDTSPPQHAPAAAPPPKAVPVSKPHHPAAAPPADSTPPEPRAAPVPTQPPDFNP